MAFKTTRRGRFGTGELTCGEFDKDVESVFFLDVSETANPQQVKGLRII
jgi:hypothetical protein